MTDEKGIRFHCEWESGPPVERLLAQELDRWRNTLRDAGFVGHDASADVGFGNLSVRFASGFVISGTDTGRLECLAESGWTHVTAWDIDRNRVVCRGPCRASSETMTHAAIYDCDRRIGAVAHGHHHALWARESGRLPTTQAGVGYGTPGMARQVAAAVRSADRVNGLIVMGGHPGGLIGFGATIEAACRALLALDRERG